MHGDRCRLHLVIALVTLGALVWAAPAVAKVFSSGNLQEKIPQVGMAKAKVYVSKGGDITDLNVSVRLSHTYTCDLIVGIQGPKENHQFTELADQRCNENEDDHFGEGKRNCSGTPTVFDDEAATEIGAAFNPYAGSFRPDEALGTYDGAPAKGNWTLYVFDINQGDKGELHCVKLNVKTA